MFSLSRAHKGSNNLAGNRTSVASNLTTQSHKASHDGFFGKATKRIVSAFDHRASWATTSSAAMTEDQDPRYLSPQVASSDTASATSAEGRNSSGKRNRNYGPMIQGLLARFDPNFHSKEGPDWRASKENRDLSSSPIRWDIKEHPARETPLPKENPPQDESSESPESTDSPESPESPESAEDDFVEQPLLRSPTPAGRSTTVTSLLTEMLPPNGTLLKSKRDTQISETSIDWVNSTAMVEPLKTKGKESFGPFKGTLRAMKSRMDMKRESSSLKKQTMSLNPEMASSWEAKVDALAAWSEECLSKGRMPDMDLVVMRKANDVLTRKDSGGSDPSTASDEIVLLSPEQDLVECFSRESCHPHQTAYFAKILKEAKTILKDEQAKSSRHGWAKEVGRILVHHKCRVPLVFRIEAAHLLLQYRWPTLENTDLLTLAWQWCHQLERTPLVLTLMHTTQKLCDLQTGDLCLLESPGKPAPPKDGYAVKDRSRCL
ncbi:hypothetical protein BT63DRAFT_408807 [Microthyrium microscopicum]|uniref:Uncharacterized protein n=1 Tax=Microthyrium microscopicum TaxID=703497 RepID=A0A6A6USB7_9PEZI|nr:hypothetical protein BT63DRAFT_408807 [Microthyrium microscopicum]